MKISMQSLYILAILLAAGLDILSNLLLCKSNGFKRKLPGFCAIGLVMVAFSCLAFASHGIDLAIAYALWGAFGILGTSVAGWLVLGQKIRPTAWLGILCLVTGIGMLHLG